MDNKWHLIFMILLFINGEDAYTLKRTIARLNHVESRHNDDIKIIREDLNVLFLKLESIDSKLGNAPGKTNTGGGTTDAMTVGHVTPVFGNKIQSLLKAFEDEKAQYNRFRREISEKVEIQTNWTNTTIQASIDKITKVLKQVVRNIENSIADNFTELGTRVQDIQNQMRQLDQTLHGQVEDMENTIAKNIANVQEKVELTWKNVSQNLIDLDSRLHDMHNITYQHEQTTQGISTCVNESNVSVGTKIYTSCLDLYNNGVRTNGIFQIHTGISISNGPTNVYCDMTTDGGGWTVFQRRQNGSVDFNRSWNEYKSGFGNLEGEFWLGNDYLYVLTDNEKTHELRVELEDFKGKRAYAKYSRFKVGSESTNYKLEVSGYTGTAGDSMEDPEFNSEDFRHNGMSFTTKDRDNDKYLGGNCATQSIAGWWFNCCYAANLNSLYGKSGKFHWYSWRKKWNLLQGSEMKLR